MIQVAEWLRNIIVAIIIAGFLEMLLPNNELKSVTKMIMGLVILGTLLLPLMKIFNLPEQISTSIPSLSNRDSHLQTQQIIAKGLKIRNQWTHQLQEQHQKMLESKVRNMIGLIDEAQLDSIQLYYQGEQLEKAVVTLKPLRRRFSETSNLQRKIIDSVQFVTDLPENQIEVNWNGR